MPASVRVIAAAIVVLLAFAAPASAHLGPEPLSVQQPFAATGTPTSDVAPSDRTSALLAASSGFDPATALATLLLVAIALGVALHRCGPVLGAALRRPRITAVVVAIVVALAAFDMAVHATHHAGDPAAEARCVAAQAASHLSAGDPGPIVVPMPVALVQPLAIDARTTIAPTAPAAPPGSRAPPVLPA